MSKAGIQWTNRGWGSCVQLKSPDSSMPPLNGIVSKPKSTLRRPRACCCKEVPSPLVLQVRLRGLLRVGMASMINKRQHTKVPDVLLQDKSLKRQLVAEQVQVTAMDVTGSSNCPAKAMTMSNL